MIVGMWMTRELVTVEPSRSAAFALGLMNTKGLRRLPVVDGGALVGMIAAPDIAKASSLGLGLADVNVGDLMVKDVATTTSETPIEEAAAILRDRKIGVLPVLRDQELVGIITESDIFRAFVSLLHSDEDGVRITFEVKTATGALAATVELAEKRKLEVVSFMTSTFQGKRIAVIRVIGKNTQPFIDDIWASGQKVLTIQRKP